MPVDRNTAASLVAELGETYAQLERDLIEQVGRRLAEGIDTPDWQAKKLAAIGTMRRYAERAVDRVTGPAQEQVARSLVQAYAAGGTEALRELAQAQSTHADWIRLANIRPGPKLTEMIDKRTGSLAQIARQIEADFPGAVSLNRLVDTTVRKLGGAHTPILRTLDDVYRQTIARTAVPSVLAGSETRRQAAQRAFTAFTRQGITGFVDGAGRGWTLAGYVEMAGRTATAQAAVEGHMDRLADAGLDLVIVSNAAMECAKCRPWEGKVLVRDGASGKRTIERESEISDETVSVEVAGSVDEAVGAGLLHPNCRHSLSAYLPGLTVAPTHTADPEGARARDRLRALERRKRELLRQEAATKPFLDGKTPPALKDRIKAVNAEIKAHVASSPDLKRKPERERIDLGLKDHGRPAPAEINTVAPAMIRTIKDRLAGGVADSRHLGGLSAKTEMLTLKDGSKLIKKVASENRTGIPEVDQQDAEELGAMVARAVGVRTPEIYRKSKNTIYMEFMEGDVADDLPENVVAALRSGQAGQRLGLADLLMGNTDRNGGNLLIHNGEITAIDHGAAFQWHPHLNAPGTAPYIGNDYWRDFVSEGTEQWLDNPLTPADVTELRRRLEALKPEFDRLKREDWYRNSMTRLDMLSQHATGKTGLIV